MSLTAKLTLYILMSLLVSCGARANDPWPNSGNRSWYENAELTPDARKHFQFEKCCNQAEVVRTKFQQRDDQWFYLDISSSTWREVPRYVIWYDKHPPENQPTMFVYGGAITCFFVPDPEI